MAEMSVKDDERQTVECPVRRVQLREDILARNILRQHLLDACQLPDNLLQPQLERRHIFNAFSHGLLPLFEIGAYYTIPPYGMQGITAEIMPILFAEVLNLTEMDYSEKLTEIPREDNIKSVTIVRIGVSVLPFIVSFHDLRLDFFWNVV